MQIKKALFTLAVCSAAMIQFSATLPDEGMYPLSEIKKIDLKKAGLKIAQAEVYNPDGISLIDALVNVGGCTGSFVSDEGLIITNHHCAFGSVQLASTPEHDYLTNGFVARTKAEEIPAKGLTCRITESYEDVSSQILSAAGEVSDPSERINAINKKMAELVKAEEAKDPSIKAEVSEMFIGRTYVLFRYKTIQDVRLVYIPQRAIGEFGGESDNWVWPRHTGDFSFMRAYVAPDGSSAAYSKDNVPYKPKKFLKVNPKGANEGDFVFILGYPGRTFKNYPSKYIEYQEKFLLPYTSSLFEWQNRQMEETSVNKELELKQASRIKGKANVLKNYKGKLKGLKGLDLVQQKRAEEKNLQLFIDSKPELKASYSALLTNIDLVYNEIFADAKKELVVNQFFGSSNAMSAANLVAGLKKKISEAKPEDRQKIYDDSKAGYLKSVSGIYEAYVLETDKRLFKHILTDALSLEGNQQINLLPEVKPAGAKENEYMVSTAVDNLYKKSIFSKPGEVEKLFSKPMADFMKFNDPFIAVATKAKQEVDAVGKLRKERDGKLNKLLADYVNVMILYKQKDFIPDANRTLRLTYGYVRGYTPVDATYMRPTTTLTGLIEKGTEQGEYYLPPIIRELYKKKDFGRFTTKDGKDVPIAFLYNLDTTGGNSGSPVMNENGELVGVNFDRAYEATINDFAWNESYSRSIGVDIRYVLWVAQKVDHADFILTELGVN